MELVGASISLLSLLCLLTESKDSNPKSILQRVLPQAVLLTDTVLRELAGCCGISSNEVFALARRTYGHNMEADRLSWLLVLRF
jgi:hypothetical protein